MMGWLKMLSRSKSKQEVLTETLRTTTHAEVVKTKRDVDAKTAHLLHLIDATLADLNRVDHHHTRNQ